MSGLGVALRDLHFRRDAIHDLTLALAAGDLPSATRAYEKLPTWAWPATTIAALRELREASKVTVDIPDRVSDLGGLAARVSQ